MAIAAAFQPDSFQLNAFQSTALVPSLYLNTNYFEVVSVNLRLNTAFQSSAFQLNAFQSSASIPSLYSNTNYFYTPSVNLGLIPSLYSDTDTFYTPQINFGLSQNSKYDSTNHFYNTYSYFQQTLTGSITNVFTIDPFFNDEWSISNIKFETDPRSHAFLTDSSLTTLNSVERKYTWSSANRKYTWLSDSRKYQLKTPTIMSVFGTSKRDYKFFVTTEMHLL